MKQLVLGHLLDQIRSLLKIASSDLPTLHAYRNPSLSDECRFREDLLVSLTKKCLPFRIANRLLILFFCGIQRRLYNLKDIRDPILAHVSL